MGEFFSLMKFEFSLVVVLAIMLILKIAKEGWTNEQFAGTFTALFVIHSIICWTGAATGAMFGEMFVNGNLQAFEKNILNTAVVIILLQSRDWMKGHAHLPEFFMLMVSSLLGMYFMISSGHMLMFFLAVELSTIPLAALCNFDLAKSRSGEAAMKMIFSSAFSSCVMLLGISFLYGTTGTLTFSELSLRASAEPLFLAGFVLFFAGFAFKLSVVPFHLWTADVYEGSPVPVTAFLSVASKGAMVFVLATVLYKVFAPLEDLWTNMMMLLSVLTMITGNLFAMRQENLKRFLAFSSITQIGFILLGISGSAMGGTASSVYFILIYVFSNLAAFGIVSMISSRTGKETIGEYRGLRKTNPVLAWTMALALFSLAGIPPTAGFFGKLFLLTEGAAKGNFTVITIAALNMMVALYYYLRVIRAMFMDEGEQPVEFMKHGGWVNAALFISVAGILITGIAGGIYEYIHNLSVY